MAKSIIVFEDTNDAQTPIRVYLATDREGDCQDEPTMGEAAALQFYSIIENIVKQANESE